jgi:hypothetical protein
MRSTQVLLAELRHIHLEILPIFSRPSEGYESTDAQLERIETKLKTILREAQQQEQFAKMGKWKASPGTTDRFVAQQRERESRAVIEEALSLQNDVEKLLGPNLMEIGKSGIENVEDLHKLQHQLRHFSTQMHSGTAGQGYEPQYPTGPQEQGGDPLVQAIAWVVLGLQWWKHGGRGKKKS